MASSIDPPRTPTAPAALVLAEAALQRQSALLQRPGDAGRAASAEWPFPGQPPGTAAPQGAAPTVPLPPMPVQADRVSLSAQAREGLLHAQAALPGPPRALAGSGPDRASYLTPAPPPAGSTGLPAQAPPRGMARAAGVALAEAVGASRPAAWPASGVAAPLRQVIDTLVRQLTQQGPAQRVVAAQPWPVGWPEPLADDPAGVPPLRTWLVGQGAVHTPEGSRAFSMALRVPGAWLQAQATAPSRAGTGVTASAGGGLSGAFAGRPQALTPGLFALVLQSPGPEGARTGALTSALLSIDFAPWLGAQGATLATVYGRDPRLADPWLQMAALQAAGWRPPEGEGEATGRGTPCDTPGCPYAGRAPCVQPFCLALRVAPAAETPPLGDPPPPPPHGPAP